MATATPAKICSVLATSQDVRTLRVDDPDLFAVTGAQLSVNRTRVPDAASPGSLALAIEGGSGPEHERVTLTRDPVVVRGGSRYLIQAQVQVSDEHPVRLGLALFGAAGELRTTRWSANLPQPGGAWTTLHRPIDPTDQIH